MWIKRDQGRFSSKGNGKSRLWPRVVGTENLSSFLLREQQTRSQLRPLNEARMPEPLALAACSIILVYSFLQLAIDMLYGGGEFELGVLR